MTTLISFVIQNARWLSAGVLLTFMSSFGQTFFISLFAAEIRTGFGLSHGEWGALYAMGTTAAAVAMIWGGGLTDRFRARALGTLVLVGLASACVALAGSRSVILLPVIVFFLRFFGQGMSRHLSMVAMARWFTRSRGRALSIANLGYSFGEITLPICIVLLMGFIDWRLIWLGSAVVALMGVPLLRGLLKQERSPRDAVDQTDSSGMFGKHWTRPECLKHWLFWAMAPTILGISAFVTTFLFHQVYFAELKGITHLALVSTFPFFTGVSIAATLAAGWSLDKWGTARLMPIMCLPIALGFVFFATAAGLPGILVGLFFMGLTAGSSATVIPAFWAEYYGTRHIGAIKAAAAALLVLGSAAGPGLTGALIDQGVSLDLQYYGVGIYFLISSALIGLAVTKANLNLKSSPVTP
ncbi:MFS transporter [Cognatishimia sp. WU-CL00825]|uniref:MFS transporter n=1 Tax=Cognatishimia sp. WU-CL00825 TaxID=3127658 RepID=UPI003109BBBC